jgi:guanylate kinase
MELSKNHKRLVIVGSAGAGKDHLRKKLQARGYKYGVSYTSRPPRDNEVYGVDYHFLTKEVFEDMIEKDMFYEHVSFNGWHYGTSREQFDTDDVFIMTPSGISLLSAEDRNNSFIIYLDIPLVVRRERLMLRNDADKVDRRLEADQIDFADFTDFDMRVTNESF